MEVVLPAAGASEGGVTALLPVEIDSPTAETPAEAGAPVAVGVVAEAVAPVAEAVAPVAEAGAGVDAVGAGGDDDIAGAVPVGVTTSETPVLLEVAAPVLVVAGAAR